MGAPPLAGIRVLELGNLIAAPLAGRIFADFGAEVVKVERPVTGDEARRWRAMGDGDSASMLFHTLGRNKRSVTINLATGEGQDLARSLVAISDVVIENFRPGTLEKWGLGPEELSSINPRCRTGAYFRLRADWTVSRPCRVRWGRGSLWRASACDGFSRPISGAGLGQHRGLCRWFVRCDRRVDVDVAPAAWRTDHRL